jgi:nucleoside-triphosphatase THEP1
VDEVGPFELQGKGWAPALQKLLKLSEKVLILVVREALLKKVIQHWKLDPKAILLAGNNRSEDFKEEILREI